MRIRSAASDAAVPSLTGMAKPVKGGYLLRYKKRLFGKAWREEWVTLFEDSTIAWFKEKEKGEPSGAILVKEAPEMMAVGQWTLGIPGRPDLPSDCRPVQLMAFGNRSRDKVHWLLAKSEQEVDDWMTAISNTLPPPPSSLKLPQDKFGRSDPVNPRLPPVPCHPGVPGDSVPRCNVNNHLGCFYPERRFREGEGTAEGLVAGAAIADWGRGWGWAHFNNHNHHHHHHPDVNVNHGYNATVNHHYSCDDYGDFGFGDVDYGMDCIGDIAF